MIALDRQHVRAQIHHSLHHYWILEGVLSGFNLGGEEFVGLARMNGKECKPIDLSATAQTLQDPYYPNIKPPNHMHSTSKASLPTVIQQTTRDKGKRKNLALIAKYFKKLYKPTNNNLITSSNTRNKNVDTTPRILVFCFCKRGECRKPKRVKDFTYHKEKMLLYKQAEKDVQLQAEQSDWLADTDEEIDEQELEAHYSYMSKIQEVPNADSSTDAEPLEQWKWVIVIFIVDENKKIQKQLKKANATLTQELTECKSILAETSRTLGESNSIQDSCLVALQNKQTEFERFKAFNDSTVDYDKLERSCQKEKHDKVVKESFTIGLITKVLSGENKGDCSLKLMSADHSLFRSNQNERKGHAKQSLEEV
ncbi:hypothetical protein Tco_0952882 [Tanacetum coccineum]|uniref:Uncharacterized protein n=1 Tax=Tanacetum coccineum TaxID=301880 RepID=A0ABQ5DZ21_9ASTR